MRRGECPTPLKLAFASKEQADAVMAVGRRPGMRPSRYGTPVRSYECFCGAWHLTKQPQRTEKRRSTT